MTLLAPSFLFLMGLAIPIVAFHMLRARRRKVVVSSTTLWNLGTRDTASSRSLRRFLASLLLLLQLATLALVAIALARPALGLLRGARGSVVLVVDASASMGATDALPTRLAAALAAAEHRSGLLPKWSSYAVVRAAAEPEVLGQGLDRRSALRVAGGAEISLGGSDVPAAVLLARQIVGAADAGKVVLITDTSPTAGATSHLAVAAVRPKAGNLALTGLEARPLPDGSGRYRWLGTVSNMSPRPARVEIRLALDGVLAYRDELTVAPWSIASVPKQASAGQLEPRGDGKPARLVLTLKAEGASDDSLQADNTRYLVLPTHRPTRVAVIKDTPGSTVGPLMTALALVPGVQISVHNRGYSPPAASVDLTIYEGFSPDEQPPLKSVIVDALPSYLPVRATKASPNLASEAIDWSASHAALRFVDPTGVGFGGVIPHSALPGSQTVIEGRYGPLLEEITTSQGSTLVMAFKPELSDIVGRAAWPIMVANIAAWGAARTGPLSYEPAAAEAILDLRQAVSSGELPQKADEVYLQNPAGRALPGALLWRLHSAGFYTLRAGAWSLPVAVSFSDAAESDTLHPLAPTALDSLGDAADQAPGASRAGQMAAKGFEISALFLWLGLAVMALEWLGYVRGRLGRGRRWRA